MANNAYNEAYPEPTGTPLIKGRAYWDKVTRECVGVFVEERATVLPNENIQVDVIFKNKNFSSRGEYTYKSYAQERGANRQIIPFMHTLIERDWCDPFRPMMAVPILPPSYKNSGQGGRRRYKKTRKVKKSRKNKAKKSRRH